MLLTSNQPSRTYPSAKTYKTHKILSVSSIITNDLKFKPITDKTGTIIFNTAKVISSYLK